MFCCTKAVVYFNTIYTFYPYITLTAMACISCPHAVTEQCEDVSLQYCWQGSIQASMATSGSFPRVLNLQELPKTSLTPFGFATHWATDTIGSTLSALSRVASKIATRSCPRCIFSSIVKIITYIIDYYYITNRLYYIYIFLSKVKSKLIKELDLDNLSSVYIYTYEA